MNEMELLRELAQETPLPAPAGAGPGPDQAARRDRRRSARLAVPSRGGAHHGPARPIRRPSGRAAAASVRPPAAPVLGAVKLMWGGAVSSAAHLIVALPFAGDVKASRAGYHRLTPAHSAHHHAGDTCRPGRDRPVAVGGAGDQPGQELGADPVHGAVRPGDAGTAVVTGGDRQERRVQALFTALTWLSGLGAVWSSGARPPARSSSRPSRCARGRRHRFQALSRRMGNRGGWNVVSALIIRVPCGGASCLEGH